MRAATPLTVLATALTCLLATAPAHARARVFVASYGNDANPCTFGSPCKTFQQAANVVDPGGEVTAIDSAGFGPISISKAVTITSPDGVEAGIVPIAGSNAMTINAGTGDAVVLRGLTVNGSGVGINGVVFNSGGSLTVVNCVAQNFAQNGIVIRPTSGTIKVIITNTIISHNGSLGILYSPPSGSASANAVIDHVVIADNLDGIDFDTTNSTGSTFAAISNSTVSDNGNTGINVNAGGPLTFSIDNVSAIGNLLGISGSGTTNVLLGRSVITGNGIGVDNSTSPNTFYTYRDNRINGNGNDLLQSLNTTPVLR